MPALPLSGTPVRAVLVIYDPPADEGNSVGHERDRITLQFNPDRVSLDKQAHWDRSAPSNAPAGSPQFVYSEPRTMTLEVFLDAPGPGGGVEKATEKLLGCCTPAAQPAATDTASAPWVRLEWGHGRSTAFLALVTRVGVTYTRFSTDGRPLRAECSLVLEEVGGRTPRQNPTSGGDGPVATHRLVAGDSLASLAWHTYGDATCWRAIARANGIDDPDRIPVGTVLALPVLDTTTDAAADGGEAR
ncbi:LysM peptidoglycan-binding domain-containing protein [Kitasatospora sp. NPDC127116]|uniref:CIS tube protein n=1 Tax=Kitasatospora sp. NPDC127116 TaxID=3345367 RepID=UPI00336F2E66